MRQLLEEGITFSADERVDMKRYGWDPALDLNEEELKRILDDANNIPVNASERLLYLNENLPYTEAKCIAKIVMSAENIAEATNNLVQGLNRLNEILLASMKGQENVDPSKRTELSTASCILF